MLSKVSHQCQTRADGLKICHSALVDPRFGNNEDAEVSNFNKPFRTIKAAIRAAKKKHPNTNSRWVLYLAPCPFREDVKLATFIDLHGMDRINSVIIGDIIADRLTSPTDEVSLTNLTIRGKIRKGAASLGLLALTETNIEADKKELIEYSSGTVQLDSCLLEQEVLENTDHSYYKSSGINRNQLTIRNTRHVRTVTTSITAGTALSDFDQESKNIRSGITSQANLFSSTFSRRFLGLLIPYNLNGASFINAHSDSHAHDFQAGAGDGSNGVEIGTIIRTAFILARKLGSFGEISLHTIKILGLPERTLKVLSSVHNGPISVKNKHPDWHGFREIPDSFLVNPIAPATIIGRADRAQIGAASDNKLFSSRVVVEPLVVRFVPEDGVNQGPLGPSMIIPDNVGVVTVKNTPVQIFIQFSATSTVGQKLTIILVALDYVQLSFVGDNANPPPANYRSVLQDTSLPSEAQYAAIIYSKTIVAPPPAIYPPNPNIGVVSGVSQVEITLIEKTTGTDGDVTFVWQAVPTPAPGLFFGPGNFTVPIPSGATQALISAAGGGGGGGLNLTTLFPDQTQVLAGGGGGGSGAAFVYTVSVLGLTSFKISVGAGGTVGINGGDTTVFVPANVTAVAGGGQSGGQPIFTRQAPTDILTPGAGGNAGVVTYTVNGQPTPPPSNLVVLPGAPGGAGGPPVIGDNAGSSTGQDGGSQPSGYVGGSGATITIAGVTGLAFASGPGGGGASFYGNGGTQADATFNSQDGAQLTSSAIPPDPDSGAGGPGQTLIPGDENGADGRVIVTFQ